MQPSKMDPSNNAKCNTEFMRAFQEATTKTGTQIPRAAIIIGVSDSGGVQLGFIEGLSRDQVVQLLIVAAEGFISVGGPGPAQRERTC